MADDPTPEPVEEPPTGDPNPGPVDEPRETDWKAESRKHERRLKEERKKREELEKQLGERAEADKTEQQKALDQARKEARDEALTEAQKERRADRLEVAVTRAAARGVKVGDGDDAKIVRFADPEDALIQVDAAVRRGDIDEDDIFDSDGKIRADGVASALRDVLDRKPHLAANGTGGPPPGDSDAGKGGPVKGDDDKSVAEVLKEIQRR